MLTGLEKIGRACYSKRHTLRALNRQRCSLFKQLSDELTPMIERSVYSRKRRSLAFKIEEFRQAIAHQVVAVSEHHIIDSMPVKVCKFARANRSKICRDTVEQSPNHGYCAAQKTHYFGYKLHAGMTSIFERC